MYIFDKTLISMLCTDTEYTFVLTEVKGFTLARHRNSNSPKLLEPSSPRKTLQLRLAIVSPKSIVFNERPRRYGEGCLGSPVGKISSPRTTPSRGAPCHNYPDRPRRIPSLELFSSAFGITRARSIARRGRSTII